MSANARKSDKKRTKIPAKDVIANLRYGGAYKEELVESQRTGKCIFCNPAWQEKALYETRDWFVRKSDYPTKDAESRNPQFHFLIVSKRHMDPLEPLRLDDTEQIRACEKWIVEHCGIKGYGIMERCGDPNISGATIRHRHRHIIVPRMKKDPRTGKLHPVPVYMPIG